MLIQWKWSTRFLVAMTYGDFRLVLSDAMYFIRYVETFRRTLLPPSSGKQYVSPKHWYLVTELRLHFSEIVILTTIISSNPT
jgi:hypothetical protein